jgi:hypothetical protein
VISSSEDLYLNTGQHKHKHIPNIHVLCGIRTHDTGFLVSEDSTCIRPLGYRGRLRNLYHSFIIAGETNHVLQETTEQYFTAVRRTRDPNIQPKALAGASRCPSVCKDDSMYVKARNFIFEILEFISALRFPRCVRSSIGNAALHQPQAALSSVFNCAEPVEVKNTVAKLSGVRLTPDETHASLIYWHLVFS